MITRKLTRELTRGLGRELGAIAASEGKNRMELSSFGKVEVQDGFKMTDFEKKVADGCFKLIHRLIEANAQNQMHIAHHVQVSAVMLQTQHISRRPFTLQKILCL